MPFDWLEYSFMRNALLAILIITPIYGLMGTMIVNNKMAFFSDSIGHSALTGIALGVIFNLKMPLISIVLFSVVFAILILIIKNINLNSNDTVISVVSSTTVATGIVILSVGGGFSKYSVFLIGDILSITPNDIRMIAVILVVVILFWGMFFNKLLLTSFNKVFVKSRGIKAGLYEAAFVIITAVVVAFSIQWVGIMIINSMLIIPAAAARNISSNMRKYHIYSVVFSVLSGVVGLIASYYTGTASGATIVLVSAVIYGITLAIKKNK